MGLVERIRSAHDHHTLQVMRQQVVAVREGQNVSSVVAAFGVNERSVFRWLVSLVEGGQGALLAKPIAGRQSKDEMKRLALSALRRMQKSLELVKSSFRQSEGWYIHTWHYFPKN